MGGKIKGDKYFWVPLLRYIFDVIVLPQIVVIDLIYLVFGVLLI